MNNSPVIRQCSLLDIMKSDQVGKKTYRCKERGSDGQYRVLQISKVKVGTGVQAQEILVISDISHEQVKEQLRFEQLKS